MKAIEWVFTVPGASRCLLEAGVPYGHVALASLLKDSRINGSVSSATSIRMAFMIRSKIVTQFLCETQSFKELVHCNLFSVACTAALVSSEPKKGDHRFYVTTFNGKQYSTRHMILQKGVRNRQEEDYTCSRVILDAICASASVEALPIDYLRHKSSIFDHDETIVNDVIENTLDDAINKLLNGETNKILFVSNKSSSISPPQEINDESKIGINVDNFNIYEDIDLPPNAYIFPGSFNPLHEGHVRLVQAALTSHGFRPQENNISHPLVVFEISISNVDKRPLSTDEVIRRIIQFCPSTNPLFSSGNFALNNIAICITAKSLFIDKAKIFNHSTFILGADTLERLLMPKYYVGASYVEMVTAMVTIANCGCSFIVGGRQTKDGKFETAHSILFPTEISTVEGHAGEQHIVDDKRLPRIVLQMMNSISEVDFRCDLSSTAIRNSQKS